MFYLVFPNLILSIMEMEAFRGGKGGSGLGISMIGAVLISGFGSSVSSGTTSGMLMAKQKPTKKG